MDHHYLQSLLFFCPRQQNNPERQGARLRTDTQCTSAAKPTHKHVNTHRRTHTHAHAHHRSQKFHPHCRVSLQGTTHSDTLTHTPFCLVPHRTPHNLGCFDESFAHGPHDPVSLGEPALVLILLCLRSQSHPSGGTGTDGQTPPRREV